MIPKTIHYVWLSNEEKPEDIIYCMSSWQKILPDYKIKCWDKNAFDINSIAFVKEACEAKKWAFAADYIRLHALYTDGGIYFDSDILVLRNFTDFINDCGFFSAVEFFDVLTKKTNMKLYIDENFHRREEASKVPGIAIQAACMASVPAHPFLQDCMEWYKDKHFVHGITYDNDGFVAPDVYAQCAEKYGFVYKDIEQKLQKSIYLVSSSLIASSFRTAKKTAYIIHCCNGSWRDENIFLKIKRLIKRFAIYFKVGSKI